MPELNTSYFDLAKPISNYLDIRGKQAQNVIAERTPEWKDQELANEAARLDILQVSNRAKIVKMALEAGSEEQAESIINSFPEARGLKIDYVGDAVSVTRPDGSVIKGPREIIASMYESQSNNPEIWQDPKMVNASIGYLLANGGDYKAPGQAKSLSELQAIAYQGGDEAEAAKIGEMIRATKKAPSTTINLPGGKAAVEFGKEQAKAAAEEEVDARKAVQSLGNLNQGVKLLGAKGGVITGPGANFLAKAGAFLSERLGINLADDAVANTQAYKAFMGRETGMVITLFGSGTGLSDADREYAEAIAGGQIELTQQALMNLLDINRRLNERKIEVWNEKADQIMAGAHAGEALYDPHIKTPKYKWPDRRKEIKAAVKQMKSSTAPEWAVEMLKNNPQYANDFQEQYGYLPE